MPTIPASSVPALTPLAAAASASRPGATPDFISADVGDTHTRIALVRVCDVGHGGCPVELLHIERYACARWPSLTDIVADFIGRLRQAGLQSRPSVCVLACAGYVQDDHVINVNLPWQVPLTSMCEQLGMKRLSVINDFEALAYAVPYVSAANTRTLLDGADGGAGGGGGLASVEGGLAGAEGGLAAGPVVVMGPGTGLGCAAVLPGRPHARVLSSEAAHIALAPGTPREVEILRVFSRVHPHVAVEHAVSGPGLLNLYRAICELRSEPPTLDLPARVTAAAITNTSPAALEALDTFCALLGSFAADLAAVYRASGGVLLAGGILPQIEAFLWRSDFRARFLRKGVMTPFLERVPVRLVDHNDLGIVGAACWLLQQPDAAGAG